MLHVVTVAIHWTFARWGLKPLVTGLFAKPFVHTKNSTCFTALYCWPLVKEGTPPVDDQWIPITKGQRHGKRFCIIASSWTTLSWWLPFEITYWTITPVKIFKLASIRHWSDTKVSYWCLTDVVLMVSVSGTHCRITQKSLPLPCLCVVLASGPLFTREKSSHHQILWSLQTAWLDVIKTVSLWHLTGISAELPSRRLSNFRLIEKV